MSEDKTNKIVTNGSSVLITGGSGLIGKHLTPLLLAEGYNVSHLSRKAIKDGKVKSSVWDPEKRSIDPEALNGMDYIVHLAGANIGEKRWTEKRKKEIIESRIDSARFLHDIISERGIKLKAFISASAVGIYGLETSEKIFTENDPPSNNFLASVCKQWEESADLFNNSGIRTVKIRTAIVMEKNDSALSKLMKPAKFGFLVKTGNGSQYMPWIHISDLCNIYLKAISDEGMNGAFNAVSPNHVNHRQFVGILSHVMKKPVFPIPVPGFILKAALGEMSDLILKGSRVSSQKIIAAGYKFKFTNLEDALKDVLK
jgi:uncharacterized protein (TIGR01777 family)